MIFSWGLLREVIITSGNLYTHQRFFKPLGSLRDFLNE